MQEYLIYKINTEKGKRNESKVISKVCENLNVSVEPLLKNKYTTLFLKNGAIKIGGRTDGIDNYQNLHECKFRCHKLFDLIPIYEQIQLQMYLTLYSRKQILITQLYKDSYETSVYHSNSEIIRKNYKRTTRLHRLV